MNMKDSQPRVKSGYVRTQCGVSYPIESSSVWHKSTQTRKDNQQDPCGSANDCITWSHMDVPANIAVETRHLTYLEDGL